MSLLREAQIFWQDFGGIDADTHASSIAYYTFLSLVPLLVLCISLTSMTGVSVQGIFDLLAPFIPDALGDLAHALATDAYERSGMAFSLSTLSLIWSASRGTKALRTGLNAAYAEEETRGPAAVAVISVVAVVALGTMIAATMWLVFENRVLYALSQLLSNLQLDDEFMGLTSLGALLAAGVLILALCYTYLPAGNRRMRQQLPGTVFALVGCGILSYAFRAYVNNVASYTVLYGSLATVALLLLWMYALFFILLAGGYINRRLGELKEKDTRS